ncbi:MAG: arylesterase [Nitrospirae bacterium]|nr:MAG: arylesterase [Nitrospirota bacterium]
MDHLLRIVCLVALLGGGLWSCNEQLGKPAPKIQGTSVDARPGTKSPPPSNAALRPEERVLVAFGDSLTAGLGVSPEEAYPARLQEKLQLSGYRYRVVNAGVSGETTAGGLRRVDWILKSKPDIVILELGGNDGLRGLNLSQTYGIPLIPFFLEGVAAKAHLNQADGIHPTGAGYAVIVQNAWPIIKPLLKK